MTVRTLVTYPDQRLFKAAAVVDVFDDDLRAIAQDLFETMRDASGVGITAPHIGLLKRIVVLSLPDASLPQHEADTAYQVYINPEIVAMSEDTVQFEEGSISMPGVIEKLVRSARVTIRYKDLNGITQTEEADGFRAVCHQHEIDQLNGIFWIDKLSRLKRERVVTRFTKLRRGT